MTLEEMGRQKPSFRNTSWHKAHLTSIYTEIRDTSSEITWFTDSSDIFPRSEVEADRDELYKRSSELSKKGPRKAMCTAVLATASRCI